MALAAGRFEDAAAEAESALSLAAAMVPSLYGSIAVRILATVALRGGDVQTAAQHAEKLSAPGYDFGSAYEADCARLVAAQVEEARRGPRAAMVLLAEILAELPERRYLLISDPANAPWLVRAALAAGDRRQAERVVLVIGEISQGNPAFAVVRASADHAQGLLEPNVSRLRNAAAQHADPWARSCATEDLGILLAATGSHDDAVLHLDEALQGYTAMGAARDAARTRRRLRRLGVRRRHWATGKRPAIGWGSLTDTERATAELVAHGLTNRQVARQLFVSAHTVAFHLRQVFRKLDIRSRVELTRIALEHGDGQGQDARLLGVVCTRGADALRAAGQRSLRPEARGDLAGRSGG